MRRERLIYLALLLVTVAVYWPLARCQFINFDDPFYVTANDEVRQGLTPATVRWAFQANVSSNWHPLTLLSHMLDCQLFGLNAGAHHLVNLLWHLANTLLLFHLLRRITRELWPSALVAALFALHPLHVESVVWISERKDVLSTFFGLLTLLMYVRYARSLSTVGPRCARPDTHSVSLPDREGTSAASVGTSCPPSAVLLRGTGASSGGATLDYVLALLFFALGLMSKPMLVTLPFVLLLLDYWPLQRLSSVEPSAPRSNAPSSRGPNWRRVLLEKVPFLALSAASSVVAVYAQRTGESMVSSGMIDFWERVNNALVSYVRYLGKAFWPQGLCPFYPHPFEQPDWQPLGAAALLAVVTIAAWSQVRRRPYLLVGWLWFIGTLVPVIGLVQVGAQAMADRYLYIPSIGLFLMIAWGMKDIVRQCPRAGNAAVLAGAAAVAGCIVVTSIQLSYWQNSEKLFRHALSVTTNNLAAEFLVGDELIRQRKVEEGVAHLENALRLNPKYPSAHAKLADICSRRGRYREAVEHYRAILLTKPRSFTVLNNLAWMLATNPDSEIRDGPEAVRLAEHACELTQYRLAVCVGTLAAAYAEVGRYPDAIRTGENARALALTAGQTNLASRNETLLQLYRQGHAYREVPAGPVVQNPAPAAPR